MDALWRFFRTVGWASVGVVFATAVLIPLLNAINLGDYLGAQEILVVGGLTVLGAGILAILQSLAMRNQGQTTPVQRAIFQFCQTAIAGLAAPVVADSLMDTAVNYGRGLWSMLLVSLAAAVQAFIVNQREASREAATPMAVEPGDVPRAA